MVEIRINGELISLSVSAFEQRVRDGRVPSDTLVRFSPITGDSFVPAEELEFYRDLARESTEGSRTRLPPDAAPWAAALLVGINIRVYWLSTAIDGGATASRLWTDWLPPILLNGEIWRPVTMGFTHVDFGHIFTNLVWFSLAAVLIERVLGRANLVAIYLTSVVGGSLASAWATPWTPSLGASGGVFGLIGALVVFGLRFPAELSTRQRQYFGWAMVPYILLMLYSGLQSDTTDNWAHIFGLLSGVAMTMAFSPRHPEWNRRIRRHTGVAFATILVAMGLLGPRIYPLASPEDALAAAAPRSAMPMAPDLSRGDGFAARIPAGWRASRTPAGATAYALPSAGRGGEVWWSARSKQRRIPVLASDLFTDFRSTLDDIGSRSTIVGEPVPAVVAGIEGLSVRAETGPWAIHWFAATRGEYSIQLEWWVPKQREARLAPLQARLFDAVRWDEHDELIEARRNLEVSPVPSSASALATELARAGQLSEARSLLGDLTSRFPGEPAHWVALIDTYKAEPDQAPLAASLASAPTPTVVLAVVESLRDAGRAETARGLLELAGRRWPRDKDLRKARLRADLGAKVDKDSGLPWHVVYAPDGRARAMELREALMSEPLDLESADRASSWFDQQVSIAAELARTTPTLRFNALCFLKYRYIPADAEAARERLSRDLKRWAETDVPPKWMPAELLEDASKPGFLELVH